MQPQWQFADTQGVHTYAGGNFRPGTDNRFMLRRGRVKTTYTGKMTKFVFQFDVSEKGLAIKDVYASVTEPWLEAVTLTAGMMSRPFGFEIDYSSSKRESPERGRMSQTIFSGERDLGAKITIQAPASSPWHALALEAGLYNGVGAPGAGSDASDFDTKKDLISRLSYSRKFNDDKVDLGLGASLYQGGLRQSNKFVYSFGDDGGMPAMVADSSDDNYFRIGDRQYIGGDAQLGLDLPIGKVILRGEYIQGDQPGTASSSTSPKSDPVSDYGADLNASSKYDTYRRKFNGAYFYFVWNILKSKNQLVVKYDWYDPNTDVAGDAVDAAHKFTSADIKYSTLGLGWAYLWDHNVKLLAYYDLVTNETSKNLPGFGEDVKDNVFTLRFQYSF